MSINTLVALNESEVGFAPSIILHNNAELRDIEHLTESESNLLRFDANKVTVNCTPDGNYLVEYSDNLERYIKDYHLTLEDAIEELARKYDLLEESIVIVIDESCVDKLDIKTLKENFNVRLK